MLALGVMGCSETSGAGGYGGSGGIGGGGSDGGPIVPCLSTEGRCVNGTISPHEPCCEQAVPDQANACDGTESTENPATCTATGNTVTHRLTFFAFAEDCNTGFDLDDCDGKTCVPGGLAPFEGENGVDNALGGLVPIFGGVGADLGYFNQALSDALCGATDNPSRGTCEGGVNDANACTEDGQCPGDSTWCDLDDNDCMQELEAVHIRFVVDANASEDCVNVTVLTGGEASAHILNLSDDGCASGTLGTIPIPIHGIEVPLENTIVRMTVSSEGFSHGLLGAVMDVGGEDILWILFGGRLQAAVAVSVLDIDASTPPVQDVSAVCNGLSATLVIGGIAERDTLASSHEPSKTRQKQRSARSVGAANQN